MGKKVIQEVNVPQVRGMRGPDAIADPYARGAIDEIQENVRALNNAIGAFKNTNTQNVLTEGPGINIWKTALGYRIGAKDQGVRPFLPEDGGAGAGGSTVGRWIPSSAPAEQVYISDGTWSRNVLVPLTWNSPAVALGAPATPYIIAKLTDAAGVLLDEEAAIRADKVVVEAAAAVPAPGERHIKQLLVTLNYIGVGLAGWTRHQLSDITDDKDAIDNNDAGATDYIDTSAAPFSYFELRVKPDDEDAVLQYRTRTVQLVSGFQIIERFGAWTDLSGGSGTPTETYKIQGIPPGGIKYQQLTKRSNANFDVNWDWTRAH